MALSLLPSGDVGLEPIEELESLRDTRVVNLKNASVAKANTALTAARGDLTDLLEVKIELQIKDKAGQVGLQVRRSADGTEKTVLTVDRETSTFAVDPNSSSLGPDTRKGVQSGELTVGANGKVAMHVYVDRSVIETYVTAPSRSRPGFIRHWQMPSGCRSSVTRRRR